MRNLAFASLIIFAAVIGACSAVDDFRKFTFTDGGSVNTDMMGNLPGFGEQCVNDCAPGPGAALGRPLSCFHMFGSQSVPGGMCTRSCTPGSIASCSDYGVGTADCVTVEGIGVCLPRCGTIVGRTCRPMYSCCANGNTVTDQGDCAPSNTNLCH
ncbi:MAG TPA: hypothetical protein VF334_15930 [Polyangia bacterium]